MAERPTSDVFMGFNGADRDVVRDVAAHLEVMGVTPAGHAFIDSA